MAYIYIDPNNVNEWGYNILIKDDAEKAVTPNENNCYKEFDISDSQYEDLKMERKFVRFNDSDELEFMDVEPMTWNNVEEINQYVSDNFSGDPTVDGISTATLGRKAVHDAVNAIDWSGETFPLTGHFKVLCAAKGMTWNPKDF
jgi:hypothetical protein|tara:strand:- start:3020 stop:3451 length:432 start_codon:yes stop_codon:yes gene_type:complete